jgi:glycosyltransferase 2 family protein
MATSEGRRWRWWLRASVTVIVIGAAVRFLDIGGIARQLRAMAPAWLAVALVLASVDRLPMAQKWRQLLRAAGAAAPFTAIVGIYYQATFASHVLPSAMVAEVLRGYEASRLGIPRTTLVASMAAERIIAIVGALALAAEAVIYLTFGAAIALAAGALLITAGVAAAAIVSPSLKVFLWSPRALATNLTLALAEHVLQATVVLAIAMALRLPLEPLPFCAVAILVMTVRRAVGYLESWGLAEGLSVVLYSRAGLGIESAAALALASYATLVVAAVPGAAVFLRTPWPLLPRLRSPYRASV